MIPYLFGERSAQTLYDIFYASLSLWIAFEMLRYVRSNFRPWCFYASIILILIATMDDREIAQPRLANGASRVDDL